MFLTYIDDSGNEEVRCFSALVIHESVWRETRKLIRDHRRLMKMSDGILITKELHATDLVSGRGRLGPRDVHKGRRCELYKQTLGMISKLPKVRLFNAFAARHQEAELFEHLLNRIQRTMEEWKSRALVVHDEGKDFTPLVRRMGVYNPIPSRSGYWPDGKKYKNIPTDRIVEEIIFRKSHESDFIQMADLCAYALLRSERPLESKTRYGLNNAFDILGPICITEACSRDPRGLGIIRVSP